ncbi:hypothetical protein [Moorena sp. SIO3A2]|uniref:hypothetical protein n=1 Tax=Moorena sp. SIO3A2 TaxID=2607841 RepID=UPI0013BDC325|nr:hypothetical protein [Moorena sp. SIO3A2]NEQ14830.1 hypothetical protein [Moorena sp. SIO3E2]NER91238.1 hypothetical protein [Moorena sp. SIO3A2]
MGNREQGTGNREQGTGVKHYSVKCVDTTVNANGMLIKQPLRDARYEPLRDHAWP